MISVGDNVRILTPFGSFYSAVYKVLAINGSIITIDLPGYENGADFDVIFIEAV